jgi:hypothetical protein
LSCNNDNRNKYDVFIDQISSIGINFQGSGDGGDDVMRINGGADTNIGDNQLGIGNGGNDKIIAGQNDDKLTGGGGADTLSCGDGSDKITDFNVLLKEMLVEKTRRLM